MLKQASSLARRATRWWSAPVRFTTSAAAMLRNRSGNRPRAPSSWLAHTPVGIRAPLDAQS
jgi:hypothetical protein